MTIKEQLIREIEQAPEEAIIKFMQIWQSSKQVTNHRVNLSPTKLSDFFDNRLSLKLLLTEKLTLNEIEAYRLTGLTHELFARYLLNF